MKKANIYYVATADGDQPRVRPFGTINMFDGKLYIHTGKNKRVAKQIAVNPKAEICAYDGVTWVRIACTLLEDNNAEARDSMFVAYPFLPKMPAVAEGNSGLFYLKDATATFSTLRGDTKTVKF